jgi:hypothetical protein
MRNIIINFNAAFGFADARTIYNWNMNIIEKSRTWLRNNINILLFFFASSLFEIIIKREHEALDEGGKGWKYLKLIFTN